MEKLLYTGAQGLLGSALGRLDLPGAIGISRKEADLTKFDDTLSVFSRLKPDSVIHAAALVGGVAVNSSNPSKFLEANLRLNLNVLEASRLSGVKKLVAFTSTCAFPDSTSYPLTSGNFHNGPPHHSNFGYAYSKRLLDVQIKALQIEYGLSYKVVTPANLFGPNDNFHLQHGHVIPSLIHRAHIARKKNTPLRIWGDGGALREFVYVDDLARALPRILSSPSSEPMIFTHGLETRISDLALMIVEEMGVRKGIEFDESKPNGQPRKPSDPSEFANTISEFRFTSLEDAVRATVHWFEENYPNIRGIDYEGN